METGTVVWGKFGSHPYWPARVVVLDDVPSHIKSQLKVADDSEIIYFYGTKDYGILPNSNVMGWDEGYDKNSKNKKGGKKFVEGVKEAEFRVANGRDMEAAEAGQDDGESEDEPTTPKRGRKKSESDNEGEKSPRKSEKRNKSPDRKSERSRRHSDNSEKEKKKDKRKHSSNNSEDEGRSRKKTHRETPKSPKRRETEEKNNNVVHSEDSHDTSVKHESHSNNNNNNDHGNRKKLTQQSISVVTTSICKHPIAKYFEYSVVDGLTKDGIAVSKAVYSSRRPEIQAEVHPSLASLHYLMDITCYIACLTQLHENEDAITLDWSSSIIHQVAKGSEVTFKARVVSEKNNVLILDCEASIGEKLVAKGKAIKSLVYVSGQLAKGTEGAATKKKEEEK